MRDSREFRGLSKKTCEWLEGSLIEMRTQKYIADVDLFDLEDIRFEKKMELVYEETVGQLTGRKTKKGQEIWEADIIRLCQKNENTLTYIVQWSDTCSSWICQCIEHKSFITELGELWDFELEVIGNVYDNPELMTTPKEATEWLEAKATAYDRLMSGGLSMKEFTT